MGLEGRGAASKSIGSNAGVVVGDVDISRAVFVRPLEALRLWEDVFEGRLALALFGGGSSASMLSMSSRRSPSGSRSSVCCGFRFRRFKTLGGDGALDGFKIGYHHFFSKSGAEVAPCSPDRMKRYSRVPFHATGDLMSCGR